MLIDELRIEFSTLRDIRNLLSRQSVRPEDLRELRYGVVQLKVLCTELRRRLLPVIRDRLGVSGLARARRTIDAGQRIQRELLCYAFPHNLDRLEALTRNLEALLR